MTESPKKIQTILVVDDVKENADLLEAILSAEYTIKTASRGSEALEIARTTPPDLILLDIMMPEMDGYEVCMALKADITTQKIPVIFVTALLSTGDETRGFEVGSVDYITKPVVSAVVRTRVKAQLALKDAQDELEEWNYNLKKRLLYSIAAIRKKTEALMTAEEKASDLHGYAQSVELISGIFELMEDRFGVCSRAVSELAGEAARAMKLSAETVAKVRLAGLLHDAGTLGARRGLSEKLEAEMTTNEQKEFHAHPVRGQELFKKLEELQDVGQMVRGHHENYDGSGFPDGIREDAIPLGARLIAIATCIEHAASSVTELRDEYALLKVGLNSGTVLDPRLISYFRMITRIMYFDGKKTGAAGEVEVPPGDLISGMRISRDLSNAGGVLLLQKGDILDAAGIAIIRRNTPVNPKSPCGVWMYVSAAESGNNAVIV
jgi:putative two-component system response regulator